MEEVVMKFAAVVLIVERYMMLASDWLQASGPWWRIGKGLLALLPSFIIEPIRFVIGDT